MLEEPKSNDSSMIIAQVLDEMKKELGDKFSLATVNLADLERRTGISRARLRKLKVNGFVDKPHGNCGKKSKPTVMSGYTGIVDDFLRNSVTNSEVIYDRIKALGYSGGKTSLKDYIHSHKNLVPAKRQSVSSQ